MIVYKEEWKKAYEDFLSQIIFQNLQEEYALHFVKDLVLWSKLRPGIY